MQEARCDNLICSLAGRIVPTEILTPDSDLEDAYNGYIVALWDGGIGARLANHSLFTLSCPAWQFIAGFRAIPACNGLRGLQVNLLLLLISALYVMTLAGSTLVARQPFLADRW